MRTIAKQVRGGFHLNQSHSTPPQTPAQASSRWGGFAYKAAVQHSLLDEQYHLCCYSEFRADEEGLGYHIEHVENKSLNPQRTFDYSNLAASALDSECGLQSLKRVDPSATEVVFGGHAPGKRQGCDPVQFISCHQPGGARFFSYVSDGRVVPNENLDAGSKANARYTIDLLNLNSPFLLTRRRQWWGELEDLLGDHLAKAWSLPHLASTDLLPTNGKLSRFFSLTRQFFGTVAENTLQKHAPTLL